MLGYNQNYIVFDTETEGLNLRYSRPWELSFLLARGKTIIDKHQIYIDVPDLVISDTVAKLTGFDNRKYQESKRPVKLVWDFFKRFLYDPNYLIVGQNIVFYDIWMLANLARMAGEVMDFSCMLKFLDTRFLALAYKNNISKPRDGQFLSWFYKLNNDPNVKGRVSQLSLLKEYGIEFEEEKLHDGLYDCEKTWEIFLHLKECMKL